MAEGILAEPVSEQHQTNFEPDFDEREYQKWIGTFRDIPEDIIEQLAENRARNEYIGATYVGNRKKYGKTIIFADRWYQCEAIAEYLEKRGVNAGSVYSHVTRGVNKKSADENNRRVLEAFKAGKLDVILNVRMLTEGTDLPDAESAFITRQTTSRNLLTQMVGRALRGPKFGGTEKAHLVFFTDNWQQLINWAEYEMPDGGIGGKEPKPGERPPLQYISIELIRKLAIQIDSGLNVNATPFCSSFQRDGTSSIILLSSMGAITLSR
jgi:superfamily II DNA or RNA helicase